MAGSPNLHCNTGGGGFCEKKVFSLKKAHGKLFLAEVTPTLMQYFCSCQPQEPQIEDSGQEDTGEEQKEQAAHSTFVGSHPKGGAVGNEHGGGCKEHEGEHFFEGRAERVADFVVEETVPNGCPQDDDGYVGNDHASDPVE